MKATVFTFCATALCVFVSQGVFVSQASATVLQFDVGRNDQETTDTGWNNLSGPQASALADLTDVVDSTGAPTVVDVTYTRSGTDTGAPGANPNYAGPYPAAVAGMPASAIYDALYARRDASTITFSDLDPQLTYDFLLYGARSVSGDGVTYTATGANSASGSIFDVTNNGMSIVELTGIIPNGSNAIDLVVELQDNDADSHAGALNVIVVTAVPEPTSLMLLGLSAVGAVTRRRRLI